MRHRWPPIPEAVEGEQGDQCVLGGRTEPGGDKEGADLAAVQGGGVRLVIQPRPPEVRGRRMVEKFLFDGVPVDPAVVDRRRVTVARAGPRASSSRAKVSMSARRTENSGRDRARHQPVNWRRSRV